MRPRKKIKQEKRVQVNFLPSEFELTSPAFFPVPVRQAAPGRAERETRFVTGSVSLALI